MSKVDPNQIQQSGESEAVEQYDRNHGKFQANVPRDGAPPNIPNASPAAADPSPFKLGPT